MSTLTIPQWDRQGLLPPVDPVDPISPDRSPYQASLLDMVLRFATTPERCVVLRGFLAYRAALHRVGLVDGYFVELDHESPESLVEHSIYWYGLWSHRRNMVWKGYLQIDLCPAEDRDAQDHLNRLERQRGHHE